MNTLHIVAADGTRVAYEESQVRQMLSQGQITLDTLYWKTGMAEPRPLREFILPPQPPAAGASVLHPPTPRPRYTFTHDPTMLTYVLEALLVGYLAITFLQLLAGAGTMLLILGDNVDNDTARITVHINIAIGVARLVVLLATGVVFLMWIYRANLNCRGFGATGMKFTPGWAVGWYFVPVANLVYPFLAMREIWRVSTDPAQWEKVPGSFLLGIWWTFWLLTWFLGLFVYCSLHSHSLHYLKIAGVFVLAQDIVRLLLGISALAVVFLLHDKQKRLVDGILPTVN
jgi:hypothetical protein